MAWVWKGFGLEFYKQSLILQKKKKKKKKKRKKKRKKRETLGAFVLLRLFYSNYWVYGISLGLPIFIGSMLINKGLPRRLSGYRTYLQGRCGSNPGVRKIPQRRAWQPPPVFLSGKAHGERSLAGYSPWGRKGLDTLKLLSTHTCSLMLF